MRMLDAGKCADFYAVWKEQVTKSDVHTKIKPKTANGDTQNP